MYSPNLLDMYIGSFIVCIAVGVFALFTSTSWSDKKEISAAVFAIAVLPGFNTFAAAFVLSGLVFYVFCTLTVRINC